MNLNVKVLTSPMAPQDGSVFRFTSSDICLIRFGAFLRVNTLVNPLKFQQVNER